MSEQRYLVCGSREFKDVDKMHRFLSVLPQPKMLISGMADGADKMSVVWAETNWPSVDVKKYPVSRDDWKKYGRAAGPLRNRQMAVEGKPTHILAFPADPKNISSGTQSMINIGVELRIPTYYAGEKEWIQVTSYLH